MYIDEGFTSKRLFNLEATSSLLVSALVWSRLCRNMKQATCDTENIVRLQYIAMIHDREMKHLNLRWNIKYFRILQIRCSLSSWKCASTDVTSPGCPGSIFFHVRSRQLGATEATATAVHTNSCWIYPIGELYFLSWRNTTRRKIRNILWSWTHVEGNILPLRLPAE